MYITMYITMHVYYHACTSEESVLQDLSDILKPTLQKLKKQILKYFLYTGNAS